MQFIKALSVLFHLFANRSSRNVILIATRQTILSLRLNLFTVTQHSEYEPDSTFWTHPTANGLKSFRQEL